MPPMMITGISSAGSAPRGVHRAHRGRVGRRPDRLGRVLRAGRRAVADRCPHIRGRGGGDHLHADPRGERPAHGRRAQVRRSREPDPPARREPGADRAREAPRPGPPDPRASTPGSSSRSSTSSGSRSRCTCRSSSCRAACRSAGPIHGCEEVARSEYSRIGGIPVAVFGVGLSLLLLTLAIAWWRTDLYALLLAHYGLSLAGVLFEVYFLYIQVFVLRRGVHLVHELRRVAHRPVRHRAHRLDARLADASSRNPDRRPQRERPRQQRERDAQRADGQRQPGREDAAPDEASRLRRTRPRS